MTAQPLLESLATMRPLTLAQTLGCLATSLLLVGCGDSGSSAQSTPTQRGVVASASDCVSFGPDAVQACAGAIERAVARHEANSTSYPNLQLCESEVGESKCERAASGRYQARLSAFMVTIAATARAEPLYPTSDGAIGFQTASKSALLASDRSLVFSSLAMSVAETQAAQSKGRRRKL